MATRHTCCIGAHIAGIHGKEMRRLTRDWCTACAGSQFTETLEGLVHQFEAEVRRQMSVLKIGFTPQPAVAPAPSGVNTSTSGRTIKAQFWFDGGLAPGEHAFSVKTVSQLANVLVALLTPAAVVAFVMGIWRLCMDLGWAGAFLISGGFFSHWQVWMALAIGLKMASSTLIAWGSRNGKFSEEN